MNASKRPLEDPKHARTRFKFTPQLQHAINLMVWEGADYQTAAKAAGIGPQTLREATIQPDVLKYRLAQRKMLLASDGERNIMRLRAIRDHLPNMPAVMAIDRLMALESDAPGQQLGAHQSDHGPGVTIVISSPVAPQLPHSSGRSQTIDIAARPSDDNSEG